MATTSLAARVTRVRRNPILNPDGTVTDRVTTEYMVGTYGPFEATLPAADFSAARVKAAIDKMVAELSQLPA
jgi:hypothetical protein